MTGPKLSHESVIEPSIVILASRFDLACDRVVAALHARGAAYLRINVEDLPSSVVCMDPEVREVTVTIAGTSYRITADRLKAIYFRQPTFLRGSTATREAPVDRMLREHRAAFLRNLLIFHEARWLNHPGSTYVAEHKPLQLARATALGFTIPWTRVSNSAALGLESMAPKTQLAIKGLDTVLYGDSTEESFGYTVIATRQEVCNANFVAAPVIVQHALTRKLDLRVTVVGTQTWCAAIEKDGQSIFGDWRLAKDHAELRDFPLPEDVRARCVRLTRDLGLRFGAIDLALSQGKYYFLEINPTGEWAWLEHSLEWRISDAIATELLAMEHPAPKTEPHGMLRQFVDDAVLCQFRGIPTAKRRIDERLQSRLVAYEDELDRLVADLGNLTEEVLKRHETSEADRIKRVEDKAKSNLIAMSLGVPVVFAAFTFFLSERAIQVLPLGILVFATAALLLGVGYMLISGTTAMLALGVQEQWTVTLEAEAAATPARSLAMRVWTVEQNQLASSLRSNWLMVSYRSLRSGVFCFAFLIILLALAFFYVSRTDPQRLLPREPPRVGLGSSSY
jgi:hypothetical protein